MRPSRPANVAAACRAHEEHGARARCGWSTPGPVSTSPPTAALAYGAWDVLDGARHASTLLEAVASSHAVVGTTALERAGRLEPQAARRAGRGARGGAGSLSLVFGPEATGLTAAERDLCHRLVRIPTDPAQPSLNLAQAVLLWRTSCASGCCRRPAAAGPDGRAAGERRRGGAGDRRAARGARRGRVSRPPQPGSHPRGAARARHARASDAARGGAAARPRAPGGAGRAALRSDGPAPDNRSGAAGMGTDETRAREPGRRPQLPGAAAAARGGGAAGRRPRAARPRVPAGDRRLARGGDAGRGVDERPVALLPVSARRRGQPGDPQQAADRGGDGRRFGGPRRDARRGRRAAATSDGRVRSRSGSRATCCWTCPPTTRACSIC